MSIYFFDNGPLNRACVGASPFVDLCMRPICQQKKQYQNMEKQFENSSGKESFMSNLLELSDEVNQALYNRLSQDKSAGELNPSPKRPKIEELDRVEEGKDLQIQVNAKYFNPEHISIKTNGNVLTVEAKVEEENQEDGTYYFRQLRKMFRLPENVDPEAVTCKMTKDGLLTIQAPVKQTKTDKRVVRVTMESAPLESKHAVGEKNESDKR